MVNASSTACSSCDGVFGAADRLFGAGRGASVCRDLDPGSGDDPQVRLPDARADGQWLAGVAGRDAVVVRLEHDQRGARRDPVDRDLGRERQRRQLPQRLCGAELADGAPTSATSVGDDRGERVE